MKNFGIWSYLGMRAPGSMEHHENPAVALHEIVEGQRILSSQKDRIR